MKIINSGIKFFSVIAPLLMFNLRQQKDITGYYGNSPGSILLYLSSRIQCRKTEKCPQKREDFIMGCLCLACHEKGIQGCYPVQTFFRRGGWNVQSELLQNWGYGHWKRPLMNILRSKNWLETELIERRTVQDWSAGKACLIQNRGELTW